VPLVPPTSRSPQVDQLAVALGYVNWNMPIGSAAGGAVGYTSGVVYVVGMFIPLGSTVTNVVLLVNTAAAGTAPTGFFVGLAGPTGTMVAQSNNLAAAGGPLAVGPNAMALSATYTASPSDSTTGFFYVAILQNGSWGTTQPLCVVGLQGNGTALGSNPRHHATGGTTGLTALPANGQAIGGGLTAGNTPKAWFVGVS
jgi:hypothetical protein